MDEVAIHAREGGDTEEKTKEIIAKRNEAMQALSEKQREIAQTVKDAKQEAYDNQVAAEREVAESTNSLVTGQPVITPPGETGEKRKERGGE